MTIKLKYEYERFGNGPGINAERNGDRCSNHHVLPYYVMKYVGLLCAALVKRGTLNTDDKTRLNELAGNTLDPLLAVINIDPNDDSRFIFPMRSPAGPPAAVSNYVSQVAWVGYNLFTGPSAKFRDVDPSQTVEPTKPASLKTARWESIRKLWDNVKQVNALRTSGETRDISVSDTNAVAIARAFLDSFQAAAAPHSTVVSDWLAVNGNNIYTCSVGLSSKIMKDPLEKDNIKNYTLKLNPGSTISGLQAGGYIRIVGFEKEACKGVTRQGAPSDGTKDFVTEFTG
jgi:hypothetical protein